MIYIEEAILIWSPTIPTCDYIDTGDLVEAMVFDKIVPVMNSTDASGEVIIRDAMRWKNIFDSAYKDMYIVGMSSAKDYDVRGVSEYAPDSYSRNNKTGKGVLVKGKPKPSIVGPNVFNAAFRYGLLRGSTIIKLRTENKEIFKTIWDQIH